jgi:GT2 family glycosyltransferase
MISVVVITRDRRDDLARTLAKLAGLPEHPAVIVVDHGSTDGTPAMVARDFPAVQLLAPGEDAGGGGRTHGVLAATTPYVAFCDDDSWWEPGSLARAEALLDAHPDIGLLGARVLLEGSRLEPTCEAMAASPLAGRPDLPGPRVLGFVACGSVVRRRAYLAAGGFPPRWGVGGEEAPFAAELADRGWQLIYDAGLLAQHRPSAQRDRAARDVTAARNDLWLAWTRRRVRAAVVASVRDVLRPGGREGFVAAAREVGWARRARRPLGARTEREAARIARAR